MRRVAHAASGSRPRALAQQTDTQQMDSTEALVDALVRQDVARATALVRQLQPKSEIRRALLAAIGVQRVSANTLEATLDALSDPQLLLDGAELVTLVGDIALNNKYTLN